MERKYVRDSSEHALIEAEKKVRDLAAANAWLGEGLHETKVGEVADVGASGVGEGERVTPEEPLKPYDGYRHEGKPDEGQG